MKSRIRYSLATQVIDASIQARSGVYSEAAFNNAINHIMGVTKILPTTIQHIAFDDNIKIAFPNVQFLGKTDKIEKPLNT